MAERRESRPSAPSPYPPQERYFRKEENLVCEEIAQREGDRLLKQRPPDRTGAEVAHRIAAIMRIRRDQLLEPF